MLGSSFSNGISGSISDQNRINNNGISIFNGNSMGSIISNVSPIWNSKNSTSSPALSYSSSHCNNNSSGSSNRLYHTLVFVKFNDYVYFTTRLVYFSCSEAISFFAKIQSVLK